MTEPSHAVFLSYASQDQQAAQRICDALRAAGIEVWLDQSELRGGDAWDQKIRRQIKTCALFLPLISKHGEQGLLAALAAFTIVETLQFVAGIAVTGNVADAFVWQALINDLAIALVAVAIAVAIWPPGSRMRAEASRVD